MEQAVAATRMQPWRAWPALRSVTRARQVIAVQELRGAPITGEFPAVELIYLRVLRAWAKRDVARVGLGLELHRAEKGEYPDSVDALAPEYLNEVPPDPFTGKPLRYVKTNKGFSVYSVGENLKDDAGRFDSRNWTLDIPWMGGDQTPKGEAGR